MSGVTDTPSSAGTAAAPTPTLTVANAAAVPSVAFTVNVTGAVTGAVASVSAPAAVRVNPDGRLADDQVTAAPWLSVAPNCDGVGGRHLDGGGPDD